MNNSIRNYFDDSIALNGFTKFIRNDYTGRSVIAEIYGNYRFNDNLRLFAGFDQRWLNTDQYFLSVSNFGIGSKTFSTRAAFNSLPFRSGPSVFNWLTSD